MLNHTALLLLLILYAHQGLFLSSAADYAIATLTVSLNTITYYSNQDGCFITFRMRNVHAVVTDSIKNQICASPGFDYQDQLHDSASGSGNYPYTDYFTEDLQTTQNLLDASYALPLDGIVLNNCMFNVLDNASLIVSASIESWYQEKEGILSTYASSSISLDYDATSDSTLNLVSLFTPTAYTPTKQEEVIIPAVSNGQPSASTLAYMITVECGAACWANYTAVVSPRKSTKKSTTHTSTLISTTTEASSTLWESTAAEAATSQSTDSVATTRTSNFTSTISAIASVTYKTASVNTVTTSATAVASTAEGATTNTQMALSTISTSTGPRIVSNAEITAVLGAIIGVLVMLLCAQAIIIILAWRQGFRVWPLSCKSTSNLEKSDYEMASSNSQYTKTNSAGQLISPGDAANGAAYTSVVYAPEYSEVRNESAVQDDYSETAPYARPHSSVIPTNNAAENLSYDIEDND